MADQTEGKKEGSPLKITAVKITHAEGIPMGSHSLGREFRHGKWRPGLAGPR